MKELFLSEINIYPLKSCGGFSVSEAWVQSEGLQNDRRWMVVGPDGQFRTQRDLPRMALIRVRMKDGGVELEAPEMPTLNVALVEKSEFQKSVEVWGDTCLAIDQGSSVNGWLSEFLGEPLSLVYLPRANARKIGQSFAREDDTVTFADRYPLLLLSKASLDDVNQRLDRPIPMNRFRPNLVVEGCDAFAEDGWRAITIGDVQFDVVKPCTRCSVPTVDQLTGEQGTEPMKTLATYRKRDGKVLFGQNIIPRSLGKLFVGTPVQVNTMT